MYKFQFLLVLIFCLLVAGGPLKDEYQLSRRVVKGSNITNTQGAFAVYITKKDSDGTTRFCGGSIISAEYVITAAHCVVDSNNTVPHPAAVTVGYGSNNLTSQTTVSAANLTVHPSYIVGGQKNRTNDVAIIRIPKLTLGDNIKRIAIYSKQIKEKTSIKAYGWGQTEDGKQSIILRGATLITGTLSDCKKLQSDFVDNGPLICLPGKYTSGVSTCSGDSGTGATLDDGKTPMLAAFDSHVRWEGVQTCSATTSVHYFVHVYYHLNFIMSATSLSKDDLCKA